MWNKKENCVILKNKWLFCYLNKQRVNKHRYDNENTIELK